MSFVSVKFMHFGVSGLLLLLIMQHARVTSLLLLLLLIMQLIPSPWRRLDLSWDYPGV